MRLRFGYIALFFSLFSSSLLGQIRPSENLSVIKWEQGGVVIHLKDELKHPMFSWPESIVQYGLDFSPKGILQQELSLIEEATGKSIPFQLNDVEISNKRIQKAKLVFMSDLPSGSNKSFRLVPAKATPHQKFESKVSDIKVIKTSSYVLISNGKVKIELPINGSSKITAPILRYGDARSWLGYGEMPASLLPLKMTVKELDAGAVQAAYQVDYIFKGNKSYKVILRITAGMDFVEMEEEIQGFSVQDAAAWRMVWNGLKMDQRYTSTRAALIDNKQKGYQNVSWEPMEGLPANYTSEKHPELDFDQRNEEDGKLPFRITPYDNWMSWWRMPVAAFWSKQAQTTVGLFIKDIEKWNDGLYALWGSKKDLNISFHWKNKELDYTFPLVSGSRSTGIAAYAHQKDIDLVNEGKNTLVYIDSLRKWHGWITLDKVKNWVLDYEAVESGYPRYFKSKNAPVNFTLSSLENSLFNNLKTISMGSERVNGPNPVSSRVYYDMIGPSFDLNAGKMTKEQFTKLRAWFLFISYLYMDETLMPMKTMLSGHPNFLADIKGVPGITAFLFPKHPEAGNMADHYEKFVQLNYNYHVRPDVPSWESKGGRWTENLATYTWAALKPTIRTSYLLNHSYDGKNRLLQPGLSIYGNWLLNAISSPLVQKDNRRVYPPQGAHAHAYGDGPPNALRLLGQEVAYYDPLLAESIFWLTTAEDSPFESNKDKDKAWTEMLKGKWETNKGTNPHLKSEKFTGYGIVLRSNFGTKDEMYVNLQQIDEGPNYRWGRAAMGGNGVLYYYAQGKRYSHNGSEDVGDGPFGDVERSTNFGVKKVGGYRTLGPYRSVGRNELTEPLYDFGFAQFACVLGNKDIAADYKSRSVLQSSADYIAVYDEVTNSTTEGRFSWFVGSEDDFPDIYQLKPGVAAKSADIKPGKSNYHKDPEVMPTKGRYYDGKGAFLTVVTHKKGVKAIATDFGAIVNKPEGKTDLIFRNSNTVSYNKDGIRFVGTAGIVQKSGLVYSAALFAGSMVEVPGIKIDLSLQNEAAIGFETSANGFNGTFQSRKALVVTMSSSLTGLVFYLNGVVVEGMRLTGNAVQFTLPAGKHNWQWRNNGVIPMATKVIGSTVKSGEVKLEWQAVPTAESYEIELSDDGGNHWRSFQSQLKTNTTILKGLVNESKVHVRVIAKGAGGRSVPGNEYPVYVTDQVPVAPQGLRLDIDSREIKIFWGNILGAGSYKLYRKSKGSPVSAFTKIYEGAKSSFTDQKLSNKTIYEYVVTAVNGNGESNYSTSVDNDPTSFLNWHPMGKEGFRRDTEDHENGFVEFNPFVEDQKPVLKYPGIK